MESSAVNRFDMDFPLISASMGGAARRGVALFDVVAAFPSLEWRWICRALRRLGPPQWLRKLVRCLLLGSSAVISFRGSIASAAVLPARGVKQGCPTSGSAWALAVDPSVRAAAYSALRAGGFLGAFADALSAAFRDHVEGLRALLPVLLQMRRAAGLCLDLGTTSVVNFGTLPLAWLEAGLRETLAAPTLCVRPEAASLGFVVTPMVADRVWDSAVRKFMERVAYVPQAPGHTGDRLVAYATLAFSTLRYRAQVLDPCTCTLRAEAAALASILASPMYALHPDLPLAYARRAGVADPHCHHAPSRRGARRRARQDPVGG